MQRTLRRQYVEKAATTSSTLTSGGHQVTVVRPSVCLSHRLSQILYHTFPQIIANGTNSKMLESILSEKRTKSGVSPGRFCRLTFKNTTEVTALVKSNLM